MTNNPDVFSAAAKIAHAYVDLTSDLLQIIGQQLDRSSEDGKLDPKVKEMLLGIIDSIKKHKAPVEEAVDQLNAMKERGGENE